MMRTVSLLLYPVLAVTMAFGDTTAKPTTSDSIYSIDIRVIFADTTGIVGTVPMDLMDIGFDLKQTFDYGSYALWNQISLNVFGDDHASALVFPDHYLTVEARGETGSGDLKAQVEIVHVPQRDERRSRTNIGNLLEDDLRFEIDERTGRPQRLMPIIRSAALLEEGEWSLFGGIPVRVNSQRQISGNRISSSPLSSDTTRPVGRERYLILAVQLNEVQ